MKKPEVATRQETVKALFDEIDREGMKDAIDHVRDRVRLGEPYGLAIFLTAKEYGVDKSLLASFMSKLQKLKRP